MEAHNGGGVDKATGGELISPVLLCHRAAIIGNRKRRGAAGTYTCRAGDVFFTVVSKRRVGGGGAPARPRITDRKTHCSYKVTCHYDRRSLIFPQWSHTATAKRRDSV
jgi:hypothetical protein